MKIWNSTLKYCFKVKAELFKTTYFSDVGAERSPFPGSWCSSLFKTDFTQQPSATSCSEKKCFGVSKRSLSAWAPAGLDCQRLQAAGVNGLISVLIRWDKKWTTGQEFKLLSEGVFFLLTAVFSLFLSFLSSNLFLASIMLMSISCFSSAVINSQSCRVSLGWKQKNLCLSFIWSKFAFQARLRFPVTSDQVKHL